MPVTVWKGQLGFGLVSVPVRMYRAARKERVRMRYAAPADVPTAVLPGEREAEKPIPLAGPNRPAEETAEPRHAVRTATPPGDSAPVGAPAVLAPVSQRIITAEGEEPVPRSELLRAHEVAPGRYVSFTPQELRALRSARSSEMQIVRTVHLGEIDPVYFETSYYLAPDRNGERVYALLFSALKESGYVALASVAMHGREHVVIVRPGDRGLIAHTMFYEDEVHRDEEYEAPLSGVNPKELQLGKAFVEAIAGPFAPGEFKDSYRDKLEALISGKADRLETAPIEAQAETEPAPVADIMETLRKSLESRRKTEEPMESPAPRKQPGRVTEIRKPRGARTGGARH